MADAKAQKKELERQASELKKQQKVRGLVDAWEKGVVPAFQHRG
jgi:hypothetical protein